MIILVPFGRISPEVIEELKVRLGELLAEEVSTSSPILPPQWAYEPMRDHDDAHTLLQILLEGEEHERIVGIVNRDLFVPRLNFVFGLSDPQRHRALVALPRLEQDFYHLSPDHHLFLLRTVKEAIHELGHTGGSNTVRIPAV